MGAAAARAPWHMIRAGPCDRCGMPRPSSHRAAPAQIRHMAGAGRRRVRQNPGAIAGARRPG